jgi:hypothetical protein
MLVANPRKQKLTIQVKDSIGLTDITIGTGEVNLSVCRRFPFCNACPFIFDIRLCNMHRWKTGEWVWFSLSSWSCFVKLGIGVSESIFVRLS